MLRKFLRVAIAVSACLVALRVGYYLLGVQFSSWDDEGYMLLSLKHYLAGGHLYTQVFTEYGPVFFWIQSSLFHIFHQQVTHDAGRRITLLLWFLASLAAGSFLYRISRSVLTASAGVLIMMLDAASMTTEPDHPQHLVLLVLMLACCASTLEESTAFFVVGALSAALFFIKVNIGVFCFIALVATWCCILRSGPIRRIGGLIFLLYFLVAPVELMHRDLHTWAAGYCVLAVLCGGLTFATAFFMSPQFAGIRSTLSFAALGAVLFSVLVLIGATLQKISLHSLLDGILLTPLHHPQLFQWPLEVSVQAPLCVALVVPASSDSIQSSAHDGRSCIGSTLFEPLWAYTSLQSSRSRIATSLLMPRSLFPWACYRTQVNGRPRSMYLACLSAFSPRLSCWKVIPSVAVRLPFPLLHCSSGRSSASTMAAGNL